MTEQYTHDELRERTQTLVQSAERVISLVSELEHEVQWVFKEAIENLERDLRTLEDQEARDKKFKEVCRDAFKKVRGDV